MALKTIILRSKLDKLRADFDALLQLDESFATREAELVAAVEEMTAETSDEDRDLIEAKAAELDGEKEAHEGEKKRLQEEIAKIEGEIADEEAKQAANAPAPEPAAVVEERKVVNTGMANRTKFFGMSVQERDAFFMRDDVKGFAARVRDVIENKRDITGGELLIPVVVLDLIRENVFDYSKLINRVRLRAVSGTARQTVMGTVPDAVWMEMCGTLNELDFDFTQVEVDGFKVGGYVALCNALIMDSDIALLSEVITGIGQAIGRTLDKAILYGEGAAKKMPLGIVTRLAQTAQPSDYPVNARPWEDLSQTHIVPITGTGAAFFAALANADAQAEGVYSRGTKFWAMNNKTYTHVKSNAIAINLYGAFVSEVGGVMPIVGGDIVVLDFIPDGDIIGGYGDLYLLAEREGTRIETSREVRFIEDQTVVRGVARYDGLPVIAEAFVVVNIDNAAPTTTATFAPDNANDASLEDLALTGGDIAFDPTTYAYDVTATGDSLTVNAIPAQDGATVTVKLGQKKYGNGIAIPLVSGANTVTVTVAQGAATLTYTLNVTAA